MVECINCKEEHKENFVQYDIIGDAWCIDCLNEEMELNV